MDVDLLCGIGVECRIYIYIYIYIGLINHQNHPEVSGTSAPGILQSTLLIQGWFRVGMNISI